MTRATTFVAACLQLRSGRDLAANIDHVAPLMREAAGAGATFIQTPEMTNIVERDRKNLFAQVDVEANDPVVAALRELARELRVDLHIGSVAVRVDGHGDRLANRGLLVSREGEVTARYDKIHLFDVDLPSGQSWRESNTYSGGREAVVAPLPWGGLGLSICYDVRFPALYHALAVEGADVLTAPSCFTRETGEAHWSVLQRARAIECGAWMISAAQAGQHEDGRATWGHSIIVDPWGRVVAEGGEEPGIVLAEIDVAAVADARLRIPALRGAKPFVVSNSNEDAAPSQAAE